MEWNKPSRESVVSNKVKVRLAGTDGQPQPPCEVEIVLKSDTEWRQQLGDKRYKVLRRQGTEPPFCGNLMEYKEEGIYSCAGCNLPLFTSFSKFNSGTGWPSFFAPFAQENILERADRNHGMVRTEVLCIRCRGHLGHVFPDGPPPTGLRYCLNSQALVFLSYPKE